MAAKREQVVQTAEKYVQRGKIEPAIREYKKLLEENPNDINTLNRVGDLYARIQRVDEAIDFFTQIAEQYSGEGFFVKAIAIYKKIIKLDPVRIDVYESLAELYHRQGLINEARTQYQVLADYYLKHENATSAIAIYQKMAELEPDNPSHRVRLAELYHQQRLTEKALGEYRLIAELMLRHGRANEAARVYERALDLDDDNLAFLGEAARTLRAAGHEELSARFLESAAERNPRAREVLARFVREEPRSGPVAVPPPQAAPPLAPPPTAPLAAPVPVAPEPPAAVAPSEPEPAPFFEQPRVELPTAAAEEEIDLDLDDAFVLELEDDEAPASLVQPPPDMLGVEPRLPAWAQGPGEEAVPPLSRNALWQEPEVEFEIVADEAEALELPPPGTLEGEALGLPLVDLEDPLAGLEHEFFDSPLAAVPSAPPATYEPAYDPTAYDPAAYDPTTYEAEAYEIEVEAEAEALHGFEHEAVDAPTLRIDPDILEQTAAALHPAPLEREEDLVSEAEVLAKYGLEEKALDRLREAMRINPRSLAALGLMIQLLLPKGKTPRVLELANQMAQIVGETGDRDLWAKVAKRLLGAGYRIEGDRVRAPLSPGEEEPAAKAPPQRREAPPETAAPPEATPPPVEGPPAAAVPAPPPASPPSATMRLDRAEIEAAAAKAAKARKPKEGGIDSVLAGLLDPAAKPRPARKPAPPVAPEPAAPPVSAPPPPAPPAPAAAAPAPAPPAVPAAGKPAPGFFNPMEISELVESEEIDWDDDRVSTSGLGRQEAPPAPPPAAAAAPPPAAPPAELEPEEPPRSLDDSTMSWLDEADTLSSKPAPSADAFDGEGDDFFDLAGQIEQELSDEGVFAEEDFLSTPQEQSLEEIVEGFKRGVSEHLSPTDFDTHFNLGIAYREMGLLDEAIGEFQLSAEDAGHLVASCSMLGLCHLDRGQPEVAVHWFKRGLDAPNLPPEEYLGMLYDLGTAYEALGDLAKAAEQYQEIYGIDTEYRDIATRLAEVGG